jgi:hypothetical protein
MLRVVLADMIPFLCVFVVFMSVQTNGLVILSSHNHEDFNDGRNAVFAAYVILRRVAVPLFACSLYAGPLTILNELSCPAACPAAVAATCSLCSPSLSATVTTK